MKKIASCILAAILAATVLAEETSNVDYGQATQAPTLDLIWRFERETTAGVTYAVITGVAVTSGDNPAGDIAVPMSLVCSDDTPLIVKKIAAGAFVNQIGITSISIPVTIEQIGDGAFTGCTVLSAIEVDGGNPWFTSSAGKLYDKDLTKVIACPARTETLQLPITLTEICTEAFAGCHRLVSLNIPASVATIGARAFKDCTRLASVSFEGDAPTADLSIVEGASAALVFYKKPESAGWGVSPWDSLDVRDAAAEQPSGVVSTMAGNVTWHYRVINGEAEIYRNGYAAIPTATTQTYTYNQITFEWEPDGQLKIPSSLDGYPVTRIGDYAFSGCSALDVVSIPKSVRKIGSYAFANCTGITSLAIPSEVQTIGYHPFTGSAITSLVLPDSLRALDGNPLAGCDTALSVSISPDNSYYAAVNGLLYDKDIQTLVGCPARMESVSIPSSTTRIGAEAFDGCFRLRTILLPDYLTSVGASAFRDATRLSSLVFPASLSALEGPGIFEGCSRLGFVGFTGNAPTVDPQLFAGAPAALIVYVAQGTTGWKDATTALPDSGKWPSDDGYGRAISNLDVSAEAELKEGDIFVGITTNGTTRYTYTLEVLANKGVKILGISPKPVGGFEVPSAFDSSLGTLTVKTLGDNLFANSIGLLSISIPNSVTAIGDEIFKDCNVLASVTLAHGLRSIGRHPFEGTAIETIALPDTVSSIDGNIFFGCDPSVSLSVGNNNPYFAESAEGALYDKDFESLFAVPMTAEELTVPATATNIHDEAFANCIRLKAIAFLGNAPTAADGIFADTPATLKITVEEDSLGWDGDPASSALPASGLWRDRTITANAEPPIVDSNTDGTWKWTVNAGVATLYNGGSSALLDTNYNGAVSVPAEVTDSATGNKYTVVALGDRAMYGCKYVTAVTLPTTIESIGAEPFSGTKITTLSIPEHVADIGGNPAAGCSRFTGFTVDAANIDFSADAAGCLYDAAVATLLAVPARATEIYVPASVTAIADDAFAGCAVLAKVNFIGNAPTAANTIFADTPATMTSYAQASASGFSGNSWKGRPLVIVPGIDFTNVVITETNTVGDIEYEMLWTYELHTNSTPLTATLKKLENAVGDVTLKNIIFVDGKLYTVTNIAAGAIANTPALLSVTVPNTILEIGDEAFRNCTSLAEVALTYGVRYIGRQPFANTIIREIKLPDSVIDVGGNIAAGTLFTTTINIEDSSHFVYSDDGVLYNKDQTKLYACPARAEGTVTIPNTVTNIVADAFFGCHRLSYLDLPAKISTIGSGAFNVSGIWPDLSAPESIPILKSITFYGDAPTSVGYAPFEETPADMIVYVPQDNTSFGPVPGIWHDRETRYSSDPGYEYKHTDDNGTTWTVTVYKSRAELGTSDSTPVVPTSTSGEVSVPGEITIDGKTYTITSIPDGAFENCNEITAVNIPASITTIAADAFNGCTLLESITVDSKNPAYSSRNGILYSKDGKTLVKVPAKTSFAATFTEQETATKKDIVEVIGSTDPTTMTTDHNQIIELKSYGTSTTTTTTEFFPSVSIDKILSGVTAISDYAFTDCGLMPEGSTVSGTMVVKVNGKETGRKTGTFEFPVGTDSTGGHTNSYIYSQAGFYKGSVCLYHTASDSDRTVSYEIPINIPTGISYGNLAFYNSHFTSKNKSNASAPVPPPIVVNPPDGEPGDDTDDINVGFGVQAVLRNADGSESAIAEGSAIEAHVGILLSIPLSVGSAPDGSLCTVSAKGLPSGVKLVKTAVKEGRKVVKYIYAIEGTPSRVQDAKTVVLKVTNKKNKLNSSVSFSIKVLAMPGWVAGKYNGVCFDGTKEVGSATAAITAAGKLSGKIMVPSDDGKKALKLRYSAKGFSGFDEKSGAFHGTATMRVNGQTVEVPFTLSAYDGAGQLSLELPGMTAALEQNTWKRGDIVATTIEVDGFKFKLSANGKVKWSGSVEGDNGRMLSVSGSTQLLSGPSVLVYIPPKSNLVGGRCELFQLQ